MPDPHYPSIDTAALEAIIITSPKILPDSKIQVGSTILFVMKGDKAIHKRSVVLREIDPGQICFEIATGWAIKLNFMSKLLAWMEANKKWKDGGYHE